MGVLDIIEIVVLGRVRLDSWAREKRKKGRGGGRRNNLQESQVMPQLKLRVPYAPQVLAGTSYI